MEIQFHDSKTHMSTEKWVLYIIHSSKGNAILLITNQSGMSYDRETDYLVTSILVLIIRFQVSLKADVKTKSLFLYE